MKKEIILGVIIIFLIIIISYRHVPINSNSNTNDDFIEEENPYTSVWDLNQYPTDFNNKSVKIKGIISEVEYDNFESGGEGWPDQIKSGFIVECNQSSNYPPKKIEFENGESLLYFGHSSNYIWIYSENISFVEYLNKSIIIDGYFRNITDENSSWGETLYWHYIEVIDITIFPNDKKINYPAR